MASFVYAVLSITNAASVHCAARPELSPCTCEPTFAVDFVDVTCQKLDSFHQIIETLADKFDASVKVNLKISYSQLEDLEMRAFPEMHMNVVKLRLPYNNLKFLPELPFRGLSNIEFLSLADNPLEEIPKHVLVHMPLIKTLDFGKCQIRALQQDDFKSIPMLTNLFMPLNNISRIDANTFPLELAVLHLGHNEIEYLNGTLRHLDNLGTLFINMNNITSLDNELPEKSLKLLLAHNNRLKTLPANIRYMKKLEGLKVQCNRLTSLNGTLKNAVKLAELHAYDNHIEYLATDEFQLATKLGEIDMSYNRIKSLNGSLLPLQKLQKANFSYNAMEIFALDEIHGLKSLTQLDLSNNLIKKLLGSPFISHNASSRSNISYLVEFYLDHNQLKSLDGALLTLNDLRVLSLTYNQLEYIAAEDLKGLAKLEVLDISHNKLLSIRELEKAILPNLKTLRADYNEITIMDKDFHGMPVLCQADLSYNNITILSRELVAKTKCLNHKVPGNLELILEGNPVGCDFLLEEFCPLNSKPDERIRIRASCFEQYEDVCEMLMVLPSKSIITLLNDQLKKSNDALYPPLLKSLGQLDDMQLKTNNVTTITTTTTATATPAAAAATTILNATILSVTPSTLIDQLNQIKHPNDPLHVIQAENNAETTPIVERSIPLDKLHHIKENSNDLEQQHQPQLLQQYQQQTTPSIVVLNIPDKIINNANANGNANGNANANANINTKPSSKTEYATIEYVPDKINTKTLTDTLIDGVDGQGNTLHEQLHSKVLPNYNDAPQSLSMPEEPPENP